MRDLFSDDSSGYRLKTLQLYNWGVFDRKTVTFSFDDKSTILTGLNGSGKTTTVDAILTLLVPPQKRFYNLSSESRGKRERDEKNYTLGAYGSKMDEDGEGVMQCLRKKNEVISIINGIFHEPVSDRFLSLLQVRYFSGEDLKCLKIITEKELRIEDITLLLSKNNTEIAQNSRWVSVLKEKVGSRLFDSFLQYQNFFMDRFGFRSDNALKLFSQTVGLKVLGDITSFIRTYMLEDKSPMAEYEQLNTDFAHITEIEREMRKTGKEIEFLSRVVKNSEDYTHALSAKNSLEDSMEGLEGWFSLHALRLSADESGKKRSEIEDIKRKIEENDRESRGNDDLLVSLKSNDNARTLVSLTHAVEEAQAEEKRKRQRHGEYEEVASSLRKYRIALKSVLGREDYEENITAAREAAELATSEKERLMGEKDSLLLLIASLSDDIEKVRMEIESLEKRENNIPSSLVELREKISSSLGISARRVPFLGELVRVKDGEREWQEGIEKLLSDAALMLIAEREDTAAVESYLENNNLKDRIGIISREEIIRTAESTDLLSRIEIKQKDNPIASWVEDYIAEEFPHAFVTTREDFDRNEYALLKTGLIKTGDRIIKDDREDPFTKKTPLHLGWSNRERLEELNDFLYDMNEELESFKIRKNNTERSIRENESILRSLEQFSLFKSYDEIDKASALETLNERIREKEAFIATNCGCEEIEKRIAAAEEKRQRLKTEYGTLSSRKALAEDRLKKLEETERIFRKNEEKGRRSESVSRFVSSFVDELGYDSLDSLILLHTNLHERLNRELAQKEKECTENGSRLEGSMNAFLNPPLSSVPADINWSGEFSSLVPEASLACDFVELYNQKKDEDMTSLRDDFNAFLEKTLSNVVVTLAEALNSWDREIHEAVRILNRNLMRLPFNRDLKTHLRLEEKKTGDRDYRTFMKMLKEAIPDRFALIQSDGEEKKSIYAGIKKFLEKYNGDEKLKRRVLDLRNIYRFTVYEDNAEGNVSTYSDTAALSGGEKAKLTYTILASALCYQYNLDNEDEKRKGPFRFVILDEAFSKSDANNSIYALALFKELDLQLMVVTPRNGINLVEGYINSLHLVEKKENGSTSRVSSMTIEEYRKS